MQSSSTIHKKILNTKQFQTLCLLYKFRFGTSDLLARSQNDVGRRSMNARLKILCEEEYIGRNFDASYRFKRQHANYFLLTRGTKVLKDKFDLNQTVLMNIRRDQGAGELFINHNLAIFNIYSQLKRVYGDNMKFFTKSYLAEYEYFPKPLPDAYISMINNAQQDYLLEYIDSSKPFFIIKKRVMQLFNYSEENHWPSQSFPTILLVCETERLRKRVNTQILSILECFLMRELTIATTNYADISESFNQNDAIWQPANKPDSRMSLHFF